MNNYLDEQIRYYFGKSFNEMNNEEKMNITSITLAQKDFNGKTIHVSISDLIRFPNIQRCLLQWFSLTNDDIEVLGNLSTLRGVQFSNCDFFKVNKSLKGLELAVFDGCNNVPVTLLKDMEELKYLRVIDQPYFDAASLKNSINLERVYLQRTVIGNIGSLKRLSSLKLINLDCSKFNLLSLRDLKSVAQVQFKTSGEPDRDK